MGAHRPGGRAPASLHLSRGGGPAPDGDASAPDGVASGHGDRVLVASIVPFVTAWRVDHSFDYVVPDELEEKLVAGSLVRIPFGHRKVRGVVVAVDRRVAERALEEVAALVLETPIVPGPLLDLARWISDRYCAPGAATLGRFVPPRVRVRQTEATAPPPDAPIARLIPTYEGGRDLLAAIESGASGTCALQSSPEHSRGELFVELIGAAARAGGAALIAVPEVRFGSLVLDRISKDFPEIALVDSARADKDRAAAWMSLARGHWLGGGGRSAVLAPMPNLRLLIVDDEQHLAYKEDRAPRFEARRVAIERCRLQGAICVLVGNALSVESGYAVEKGRFRGVQPSRAALKASRPIIEVVPVPRDRALSHELHSRIHEALAEGGRAALLVPRAGYSRALWCAACRRSVRCPRCESGMSYERSASRMRCPRCSLVLRPPDACPSCGSTDFRYVGAGSERLFGQISKSFPRAVVARADPEVLEEGDPHARGAEIYVTTWVGTKAVLRPDVTVVGVLDADALLRKPDWRAAETSFEALTEMAAWAGPAHAGGRLVIQSDDPRHHAIQALARADHRFFLERELEHRRELGYPPFSELVRIGATGAGSEDVLRRATEVCRSENARVLGPVRQPGGTESEILAKCADALPVALGLRGILATSPAGTRVRVDVDPR